MIANVNINFFVDIANDKTVTGLVSRVAFPHPLNFALTDFSRSKF